MTVQRARWRAEQSKTRRKRLRELLLPVRPEVATFGRPGGWRTETCGPFGLGAHRDPRFYDRRWSR